MANTKQNRNAVAWTYVDGDAVSHRVSARAVYVLDVTDGDKYGGSAAASSMSGKPRGLRMRAVYCTSGGNKVLIPCYDVTAALWTTPGTTVVRNLNGVDATFTSTKDKREEKGGRQCLQSA